jgi:hypothetical protein
MNWQRLGAICVALFLVLVGIASLLLAMKPHVRKSLAEITLLDTKNKPIYMVHYVIVGIFSLIAGLVSLVIIYLH